MFTGYRILAIDTLNMDTEIPILFSITWYELHLQLMFPYLVSVHSSRQDRQVLGLQQEVSTFKYVEHVLSCRASSLSRSSS